MDPDLSRRRRPTKAGVVLDAGDARLADVLAAIAHLGCRKYAPGTVPPSRRAVLRAQKIALGVGPLTSTGPCTVRICCLRDGSVVLDLYACWASRAYVIIPERGPIRVRWGNNVTSSLDDDYAVRALRRRMCVAEEPVARVTDTDVSHLRVVDGGCAVVWERY